MAKIDTYREQHDLLMKKVDENLIKIRNGLREVRKILRRK